MGQRRFASFRVVGQLLDAVHHPDRHLFPADRTAIPMRDTRLRMPADATLAMTVKVIFPLFWKKLKGTQILIPITTFERAEERVIGPRGVKNRRLARQLGRRMGIRVRDERIAVQIRDAPTHGWVGGKASLHGKDLIGQIAKTFFHRVKTRLGAKHGKPRRPDVGGDKVAARVGLQRNLQQITRIQPQDRPAIGANVANALQPGLKEIKRRKAGEKAEIVHFAHLVMALVDVADLAAQQKAHRGVTGCGHLRLDRRKQLLFQPKEPILRRLQLGAQLGQPARVGNIPRGHHLHPLDLRPFGEVLQVEILAGRPRIVGMNV